MKTLLRLGLLLTAALIAGCELAATTDNSQVVITDGSVSSFRTQQGNVIVDLNPDRQHREIDP